MPSGNVVIITGYLGKDPELKYTGEDGKGYANFTVAVSRDYGDKTDWIRCIAFNRGNYKLAEYVAGNTYKGKLITVYGKIQVSQWKNKDGENRSMTKVVADKVVYEMEQKKADEKPAKETVEENYDDDGFEVPF